MSPLTTTDIAILALEARQWRYEGAKQQAIRDITGLTPTGYYQRLNQILDEPAAQAHDPLTVSLTVAGETPTGHGSPHE